VRAYLLREDFQRLWEYKSVARAGKFLVPRPGCIE